VLFSSDLSSIYLFQNAHTELCDGARECLHHVKIFLFVIFFNPPRKGKRKEKEKKKLDSIDNILLLLFPLFSYGIVLPSYCITAVKGLIES
jgi:hypothetical protein